MKKNFNIYIAILISIILIIFTVYSLNKEYDLKVIISFLFVIITNLFLLIACFLGEYTYFEAIMSLFYILFFIIAPILQLKEKIYPIPIDINLNNVVISNICNSCFLLFYLFFKGVRISNKNKEIEKNKKIKFSKFTLLMMGGIFLAYFIPNLGKIANQIMSRQSTNLESQIGNLIINKFIMFIPLFFVFYFIIQYKEKKSTRFIIAISLSMILLIICKNPFNEKRNALGPIYCSILLFLTMKSYSVRRFFIVISLIFVVAFPLSSIITHSNLGLIDIIKNFDNVLNYKVISEQFYKLHFDAFANLNLAIEYTQINGFSYGFQLIGAFLFFIPRSLWINKPLSSGMISGNYLIENYGFHFNNLSSPITAEAYFNAGIIGIIIFAFIMAQWSKLIYKWLKYNNYYTLISCYMIIHLFFLMRGDLMNGVAYLIGPIIAIYFLPILLEKINKCFMKKIIL